MPLGNMTQEAARAGSSAANAVLVITVSIGSRERPFLSYDVGELKFVAQVTRVLRHAQHCTA
jgi:hypothetical protein